MTAAECEIVANIAMGLRELQTMLRPPSKSVTAMANEGWAADLERQRASVMDAQLRAAAHRVSYFIGALSALPLEAEL